jgi:membrane protease YdiL (CAAX protease family)
MSWLLALFVIAWALWTNTPFAALGLRRGRHLGLTVPLGFLAGALFKLLMKAVVMPLAGAPAVNQAYHGLTGNTAALPGMLVFVLVSGALGEEIVFRGFVFERVRAWGPRRHTLAAAVLISTALFAASHYADQGWPGVTQAAATGLIFAWLYAWRGELWTVMAVHAGFDLAAVAIIYADWETRVAHLVFR